MRFYAIFAGISNLFRVNSEMVPITAEVRTNGFYESYQMDISNLIRVVCPLYNSGIRFC